MGISKKHHQMKVLPWPFQTSLFTNPDSDSKGLKRSHFPGNPAPQKYWPVQKCFSWHLSKDWKLQVMCKRMGTCKSVCGFLPMFPWMKKRTNPALQQGRFSSPWERFYKTFTQNCFPFVSQHCCLTQWPSLSTSWGSAALPVRGKKGASQHCEELSR